MLEFAAVTYGLLATFILSALGRNHREQRRSSALLRNAGYVLCGMSAGAAVILSLIAAQMMLA